MTVSRSQVVSFIYALPPDHKIRTIDQLALEAIAHVRGKVTLNDEEFVGKYRRALLNDLIIFEDTHRKKGGLRSIERENTEKLLVRWRRQMVSDERARIYLRNRALVYAWISELNNRLYECLGVVLMRHLGATKTHLTSSGNEFGIDFLAIVPAYSRSELFVSGPRGVRIVGQSKLYKGRIQRGAIQSFNNTMDSIRHNKFEIQEVVPPWFRNSPAPLLGLWTAHNGYQSGAQRLAEQNGHILLDSLMVAEILAQSKQLFHIPDSDTLLRRLWKEVSREYCGLEDDQFSVG